MSRRSDNGLTLLFRALFLIMAGWAIGAWSVMLAIGIMHNDWWAFIPPMGFATAMKVIAPAFFIALASRFFAELQK